MLRNARNGDDAPRTRRIRRAGGLGAGARSSSELEAGDASLGRRKQPGADGGLVPCLGWCVPRGGGRPVRGCAVDDDHDGRPVAGDPDKAVTVTPMTHGTHNPEMLQHRDAMRRASGNAAAALSPCARASGQGSRVISPDGAASSQRVDTSSALRNAQGDANVDPLTGLPFVHGMASHGRDHTQHARRYAGVRRVGHTTSRGKVAVRATSRGKA